ncbi:MAG: HAD family hydrolase [Parasporobacterium sp.]|nr:HAD family hydrolase [Parasporobacterium sp.]
MAKLDALPKPHEGSYRAFVFDLDGTLYDQKKLRLIMALRLLLYYLCHPGKIRELWLLKTFRQVRDNWTGDGTDVDALQYAAVAVKHHVEPALVEAVVKRWIYENPLSALPKCTDHKLADYIRDLRKEDIPVFIFSDYPIEEKLAALGLEADGMYAPGDERQIALKPSPMGLKLIMKEHGLSPDEVLMVSDRDVKDGEAARSAGVDYYITRK